MGDEGQSRSGREGREGSVKVDDDAELGARVQLGPDGQLEDVGRDVGGLVAERTQETVVDESGCFWESTQRNDFKRNL